MKNLKCLSEFFSFLSSSQSQLQTLQKQLYQSCPNPNELYRSLNRTNSKDISSTDIQYFTRGFGYNLYRPQVQGANYILLRRPSNKQELLKQSCQLLIRQYGNNNRMAFQDFCWLAFGENQPTLSTSSKNQFSAKESLFNLLQCELQNLINIQSFKRVVKEECGSLEEAFKIVTSGKRKLTEDAVRKLLNVNGIFVDQRKAMKRLKGQIDGGEFIKYFSVRALPIQTKIFQTSAKKRDLAQSNVSFGTPNKRTYITQASTSRKGPQQATVSQVHLKQFRQQQKSYQILESIAKQQANFQCKKQKLILDRDIDLQLAYDYLIQEFQPILQKLYKDNSFTSFLRFLLPFGMWQHKYLGFIRHNIDGSLAQSTVQQMRQLLADYRLKEKKLEDLWQGAQGRGMVKQELFKSLSGDTIGLTRDDVFFVLIQLLKYLSKKSTNLLFARMDRMNSGRIIIRNFD